MEKDTIVWTKFRNDRFSFNYAYDFIRGEIPAPKML